MKNNKPKTTYETTVTIRLTEADIERCKTRHVEVGGELEAAESEKRSAEATRKP